jgi:hypothetical protein
MASLKNPMGDPGASDSALTHAGGGADQVESVPLGLRWIDDAFAVAPTAGGFIVRLVDMSRAKAALRRMREARVSATLSHVVVRACALALAHNPRLHQTVCNYRRHTPGGVDIGLSMAGQTTYAPVVVLPGVDRMPLSTLVPHVIAAIDAATAKERVDLDNMRRFMWIIPFGFLRRFLLRLMNKSFWFRRRMAGTFQVSMLPTADVCAPLLFYTGAALGAGAVRDRVVAVDGQPLVRPTMWICLCADHGSFDGMMADELLDQIKATLEGDEIAQEAEDACSVLGRRTKNGLELGPGPASRETA